MTLPEETKFGTYDIRKTKTEWLKYMREIAEAEKLLIENHKKDREWQKR